MIKFKDGIKGIKYKVVSNEWRKLVDTRDIKNPKKPTNPMVLDLLAGKTIFAYNEHNKRTFGSLYATAAVNGRKLRMYYADDVDNGVFKGYVIWMEPKNGNGRKAV